MAGAAGAGAVVGLERWTEAEAPWASVPKLQVRTPPAIAQSAEFSTRRCRGRVDREGVGHDHVVDRSDAVVGHA